MEAYGVVLGVKRVCGVRAVVGVVVDAAQYETFRQGAEEQVLARVRQSSRGNGVHLAFAWSLRKLDRVPLESLGVSHLHGRIEGGLLDEQGRVDDGFLVLVVSISHQRKRGLAAHQS